MTSPQDAPGLFVGLDIGGTGLRLVLWRAGRCLASESVATSVLDTGSPAERLERLAALIAAFAAQGHKALAGIGIGASGPVDIARGVVENPYTLPALAGLPLVAELERLLACPVRLESDAVAAAVGEHRAGAGVGAERMAMVTLGTGIGVCLLVDGEPFRGAGGAHPEGGHIPVADGVERCYCGVTGCWEQVASRSALQALMRPLVPSETPDERILKVADRAATTDAVVRDVFAAYGRLVGRGLAALQGLYAPDVVVLGGSAAAHLDRFRAGLEATLARPAGLLPRMAVRRAVLPEAGAIGAALLAEERGLHSRTRGVSTAPRMTQV